MKQAKKLIFLDIDGVMNCEVYFRHQIEKLNVPRKFINYRFNPASLMLLKKLVEDTDSYIVISSTWRLGELKSYSIIGKNLERVGLTGRVIGITPFMGFNCSRGDEIKHYISTSKFAVDKFVILDDDSDMGDLRCNLVQVNRFIGFCHSNYLDALNYLTD